MLGICHSGTKLPRAKIRHSEITARLKPIRISVGEDFSCVDPLKIKMPPATPTRIAKMPIITLEKSALVSKNGVNIPDKNADMTKM